MGLISWENSKIRNLDAFDIGLIKLSSALFALFLVTFWPGLASLDWYWYIVLMIIVAARPMKRFLS